MLTATERRQGFREVYRERGDAGDSRELAFTVYSAVLVTIVALVPVARSAVLVMTEDPVRSMLAGPDGVRAFAVLWCGVLSLGVFLGALRGPALESPLASWTLGANDIPRRASLRAPLVRNAALVAGFSSAIALLPGVALLAIEVTSSLGLVLVVVSAFAFSVLMSFGWLVGQVLGPSFAWLISTGLLGLGLLTVAVPTLLPAAPWWWVAQTFAAKAESWPLLALIGIALVAGAIAPPLLDRVRGPSLLSQALRWESARVATITGDIELTLALFRPLPTLGRRWRAVRPGAGAAGTYWWRGLVGAARTPVRLVGALVLLVLGNVAFAGTAGGSPNASALAGAAAALVIFIGLGPLADGLRHASEAAAAPALYGFSRITHVALLAVFPASVEFASAVTAGLAVAPAAPLGVLATVLTGAVVLLCRVLHSAKGPLPLALLSPVPTPFGEASSLVVLGWQLDALLVSAAIGALTGFASANRDPALVLGAPVVVGGLVVWLAARRYAGRSAAASATRASTSAP